MVAHVPLGALVDDSGEASALAGELEHGGLIDAETVRRIACDATVVVALDDDVGHTMYEGRARRFPSDAQRREVMRRDRHCRFPGCTNVTFTNVHHVVAWKPGGRTDLDNLALLCLFHHGMVHRKGWTMSGDANAELTFVGPSGRVMTSRPSPLWTRVSALATGRRAGHSDGLSRRRRARTSRHGSASQRPHAAPVLFLGRPLHPVGRRAGPTHRPDGAGAHGPEADVGDRRHSWSRRSATGRLATRGVEGLPYDGRVPPSPDDRRPGELWVRICAWGDDGSISIEEIEDAVVDGDTPLPARSGTARAALSHRTFRIVFIGAFASNIGTWMQNVVLGAYAYDLTHSATFVGVIIFAQLGPTLILPMVGGLLADKIDRKRFLIILSIEQMVFSLGVALVASSPHPSHVLLVVMVLGVVRAARCSGPRTRPSCPGWWASRTCPAPSR